MCNSPRYTQVKTMSEALVSPTKQIATSPIVDGVWKLIFTTTTGSSGGKLGSGPSLPLCAPLSAPLTPLPATLSGSRV